MIDGAEGGASGSRFSQWFSHAGVSQPSGGSGGNSCNGSRRSSLNEEYLGHLLKGEHPV